MTTSNSNPAGLPLKAVKLSLTSRLRQKLQKRRIERARRPDDIRDVHAAYWRDVAPHEYYDRVSQRFDDWFDGPHAAFIDAVVDLSAQHNFDRLIEFGCGDGKALAQLSRRIGDVPMMIGIDLNAQIIERNRSVYAPQTEMTFVQGDLVQIAPLCAARNTLFFVYGGVLEYFTQDELNRILETLALRDCAIALAEPIDAHHDLETNLASYPFGGESSFSHNHAHLLKDAGWQIRSHEDCTYSDVRWQLIIAEATAAH